MISDYTRRQEARWDLMEAERFPPYVPVFGFNPARGKDITIFVEPSGEMMREMRICEIRTQIYSTNVSFVRVQRQPTADT